MPKEKKSFKKFAAKHLAKKIELRRKNRDVKKEIKEREEKKVKRDKRQVEQEEAQHQDDLIRLKETDPEFLEYLEQEESNLLDFGRVNEDTEVVDDDAGSDAETDEDEDAADAAGEKDDDGAAPKSTRITVAEIQQACQAKKFPEAFLIYCSAARELGYPVKDAPAHELAKRRFESPDAVKDAIVLTARLYSTNVATFVTRNDVANADELKPAYKNLVRRMLNAIFAVLSGATHDGTLLVHLAHVLPPMLRLFPLVRGSTKVALRTLLPLCANPEESTRIAAYLVVSMLAKKLSGTRSLHQSAVFKGIFLTMIKTAREYNIRALPVVGFLMNCVVDVYGTDMEAAYQHAFVYIRQLAIYLRQALQNQTQQNVRAVFNWQYLNALRTWGLVVSTYHEASQLGPLIHPVVQIALGMMDLFSSPRMCPLHLHVVEMLNHVATRSGVYIPVASYVLRVITSSFMSLDAESTRKKSRDAAANLDELDLQFCLRVKKRHAKSVPFRVNVWKDALYLLAEHLAFLSSSIGLPEVTWAVRSTLAKLKKEVKVPQINGLISSTLHRLDETCKIISQKRDAVNFGPCDIAEVRAWEEKTKTTVKLPLVVYFESLRAARVADFAAKQKAVAPRDTIEKYTRGGGKKKGGGDDKPKGKRSRDGEDGDGDDAEDDE